MTTGKQYPKDKQNSKKTGKEKIDRNNVKRKKKKSI